VSISPVCTVNSLAVPQAVAAGAGFTIQLANTTGVNFWSLSCTSTDETNTTAAVNAALTVNTSSKTASGTAPATLGSAMIFTSTVGISNLGLDQNRVYQLSYITTFKVNVLTAGGYPVIASNETVEQNATSGWIAVLNAFIRGGVTAYVGGNKLTSFSAVLNNQYSTSGKTAGLTMTVPTMTTFGQWVGIADSDGTASTKNLTVVPPAGVFLQIPSTLGYGSAGASVVMSTNGQSAQWTYDGISRLFITSLS
jgi:hypothetical protein